MQSYAPIDFCDVATKFIISFVSECHYYYLRNLLEIVSILNVAISYRLSYWPILWNNLIYQHLMKSKTFSLFHPNSGLMPKSPTDIGTKCSGCCRGPPGRDGTDRFVKHKTSLLCLTSTQFNFNISW